MASFFLKAYCRIFQKVFKIGMLFSPWRKPDIIKGAGSLNLLPAQLKARKINDVLLITDKFLSSTKHFKLLIEILDHQKIRYVVFDRAIPNPTLDIIEEAADFYKQHNCKALVAFGGGSSIDCAKGVGIRIVRPHTPFSKMRGSLKVLRQLPYLVAIPTTAGTGSEATVAVVLTNERTHEKYPINDFVLIPRLAVLDAEITLGLPPALTASTGMDALVHAIESYIGYSNFGDTERASTNAGRIIVNNIKKAYDNGNNLAAREKLLYASYLAGFAFTRAYVGYIHAVAHSLGGMYHTPHGLANAVILPHVLEQYGKHAHKRLAKFARIIGAVPKDFSDAETSAKFIALLRELNKSMNIPEHLDCIHEKDIPTLAKSAAKEANPLYPVPVIYDSKELEKLYYLVAGDKLIRN